MEEKVWLKPPATMGGEPREVLTDPKHLVPMMVAGWVQITAAEAAKLLEEK